MGVYSQENVFKMVVVVSYRFSNTVLKHELLEQGVKVFRLLALHSVCVCSYITHHWPGFFYSSDIWMKSWFNCLVSHPCHYDMKNTPELCHPCVCTTQWSPVFCQWMFSGEHWLLPQSKELMWAFLHLIGTGVLLRPLYLQGAAILKQLFLWQSFCNWSHPLWQPFCGGMHYLFLTFQKCPQAQQGWGPPEWLIDWLILLSF